ncbi:MAG TPA: type II toxin-antitoxin system Phd/YefM family antitoxin [Acholeplasmataceae bacterium]|jgi:PHD/YefM family antitoxin component YafN of YafNO toxin-antitoxin module|nr:type II toxin-antitoxin system Phd/YefM family antitoxin [Acholeplasmataceae bacterium]
MKKGISIRPSKDIRTNYAKISELARTNPVAITVNGKEDLVVLSHEDYMSKINYIAYLEEKLRLYDEIAQSLDDIKLGRVYDSETAINSLLAELDELDYE